MSPHIANFSRLSLDSIAVKPILEEKSFLCSEPGELDLPVLSSKSVDRKVQRRYTDGHKSTPNLPAPDYYRSIPSTSLPDLQQPASIEIKPLGRLTEDEIITSPYLSPKLKHTDMALQEDDIISHNSTKASKGSVTFLDSLVMMNHKDNIVLHAPHEIGPNDIIHRKEVPDLLRQDTMSTSSSNELLDYSNHSTTNSDTTIIFSSLTSDHGILTEKVESPQRQEIHT
ncbi:hypothetical protein BCV72DRAFT_111965 [Rhizopus microsporus var. microsporus]|uniref:Uncharacterized protein n=1 Tax=Rhizopus microsporus var. microsporus TaxID=86635 RepID=A0A1X0R583_RHIZD|nr:hypothetical protein BCV72DRAFT_111965 [Rhizopus microsporus var. microsporus]